MPESLHTLLPFTCPADCLSLFLVSRGSLLVRPPLSAFLPAALLFSLTLTLTWLRASWSAGSPRLRHARFDRTVYMSGGAFKLSLPRASTHVWHRFTCCRSRLFIVSLLVVCTLHLSRCFALHWAFRLACGQGLLRYPLCSGVPFVLSASSASSAPSSAR